MNFALQKEAGLPPVRHCVVNTTDDVCHQQLPSVALCLQQLRTAVVEHNAELIFFHLFSI